MDDINLDPCEFSEFIQGVLQDDNVEYRLEDIDDYLINLISNSPELDKVREVERCAKIVVELINPNIYGYSYSWALHSLLACECILGKVDEVIVNLEKLISHCESLGSKTPCISAIRNIKQGLLGEIAVDKYPYLLKVIVDFLKENDSEIEVAKCYVSAAYFFSDNDSYRSAVDVLDDALEYLEEKGNLDFGFEVLLVKHSICITNEDHSSAIKIWDELLEVCEKNEINLPDDLVLNHATLLMQLKKFDDAIKLYLEALSQQDCEVKKRAVISVNISASYRENGNLEAASKYMHDARVILAELGSDSFDDDFLLEIELIDAKNNLIYGDQNTLKKCLFSFAFRMNETLKNTFKIHYRRGIRSRYFGRFENLIASLATTGVAADIIPLLALSRINQSADWLSLLKWKEDISSIISHDELVQLSESIDRLADYGAPHLYGFAEKYDNAFYGNNNDPWDLFITQVEILKYKYDIKSPYHYTSNEYISTLLHDRIHNGNVLIFDFSASQSKLITISDNNYIIENLPDEEGRNFYIELNKFRLSGDNRTQFNQTLINYQNTLIDNIKESISILEDSGGVIFFPSKMDSFPLNILLISNDQIRKKILSGNFEIRSCLCLHPKDESFEIHSCLGMVESTTNLEYDKAEIQYFINTTGLNGEILYQPDQKDFFERVATHDSIVISQHGFSAAMFTDPVFADLAGPHAERRTLSYSYLQSHSYKMNYKLVMLNACYGGTLVNRNYFKLFRTHELLGYPQAFLLNRKSIVIAASWTIVDRYNALIMHNFSNFMKMYGPSKSYGMSLAKAFEMSISEIISALNEISGGTLQLPNEQHLDVMRGQPFCFATYQNYTLL